MLRPAALLLLLGLLVFGGGCVPVWQRSAQVRSTYQRPDARGDSSSAGSTASSAGASQSRQVASAAAPAAAHSALPVEQQQKALVGKLKVAAQKAVRATARLAVGDKLVSKGMDKQSFEEGEYQTTMSEAAYAKFLVSTKPMKLNPDPQKDLVQSIAKFKDHLFFLEGDISSGKNNVCGVTLKLKLAKDRALLPLAPPALSRFRKLQLNTPRGPLPHEVLLLIINFLLGLRGLANVLVASALVLMLDCYLRPSEGHCPQMVVEELLPARHEQALPNTAVFNPFTVELLAMRTAIDSLGLEELFDLRALRAKGM
jgi:hypothetical protein